MADLKPENSNAPGPENTNSQASQPAHAPQQTSKGEKFYDWAVYSGLNYWTNLIGSIAITDYFTNLQGRQHLKKAINSTAKGLSKTTGLSLEKAHHHSRVGWETAMLLSGGWLLLVPLKIMEDNKRPLVHWLNEKMGVQQQDDNGKKLTADEIYIEHEQPKQSWLNVVYRRLLGTAAVIATGSVLDHVAADKTKQVTKTYRINGSSYTETSYMGGKDRTTEYLAERINKTLNKLSGGKTTFGMNENSWRQRWLKLGLLDTVFTKITAAIMYATNGAKKLQKENEAEKPAAFAAPVEFSEMLVPEENTQAEGKKFTDTVTPSSIKDHAKPPTLSHAERVMADPNNLSPQAGL